MTEVNKIKDYILRSGLKSNFIAKKIGCSPSDISRWISGDRKPNRNRLRSLSSLLRVPMYKLYDAENCSRIYEKKERE